MACVPTYVRNWRPIPIRTTPFALELVTSSSGPRFVECEGQYFHHVHSFDDGLEVPDAVMTVLCRFSEGLAKAFLDLHAYTAVGFTRLNACTGTQIEELVIRRVGAKVYVSCDHCWSALDANSLTQQLRYADYLKLSEKPIELEYIIVDNGEWVPRIPGDLPAGRRPTYEEFQKLNCPFATHLLVRQLWQGDPRFVEIKSFQTGLNGFQPGEQQQTPAHTPIVEPGSRHDSRVFSTASGQGAPSLNGIGETLDVAPAFPQNL